MMQSISSILILATFLVLNTESFSPSFNPSSNAISQIVKEHQRFQPLSVNDDDDDIESDIPSLDDDDTDADDIILNVGDLESEEGLDGISDDGLPPAWAVAQQKILDARLKFRRHDSDTGSPEYQIAGMSERINYLTRHLQQHPKDFSTRRGLVALVNKRRRLLNYLVREDVTRYYDIIQSLGIRHKAPGLVPSRDEKYSRFPQQKVPKKHLITKK